MHFTEEELEDETRAEWYLRQMLGSANFEGGRAAAHPERQPGLPDRAPPVPGPAQQPLPRDLGQGARALRQVRHPVHDRAAAPAVRPGAAHDHEAVAAQRDDRQRRPGPAGALATPPTSRAATASAGPTTSASRGVASWAPGRAARASGAPADGRRTPLLRRAAPRRRAGCPGAVRLRHRRPVRRPRGRALGARARQAPGHPVRAEPGLRGLRLRARPPARVPRHRRTRSAATRSTSRRATSSAPRRWSRRTPRSTQPVLGQDDVPAAWLLVTTAASSSCGPPRGRGPPADVPAELDPQPSQLTQAGNDADHPSERTP